MIWEILFYLFWLFCLMFHFSVQVPLLELNILEWCCQHIDSSSRPFYHYCPSVSYLLLLWGANGQYLYIYLSSFVTHHKLKENQKENEMLLFFVTFYQKEIIHPKTLNRILMLAFFKGFLFQVKSWLEIHSFCIIKKL